jgi:hypothetical protein
LIFPGEIVVGLELGWHVLEVDLERGFEVRHQHIAAAVVVRIVPVGKL